MKTYPHIVIAQHNNRIDTTTSRHLWPVFNRIDNHIIYEEERNVFLIYPRLTDTLLIAPVLLTPSEYLQLRTRQLQKDYFMERNRQAFLHPPPLKNIRSLRKKQNTIFGEGGIRLTTKGNVYIQTGMKNIRTENPTLSENARNRTHFDFSAQTDLQVKGEIGNRLELDIIYQNSPDGFTGKKEFRMTYTGDEDDILRSVEVGKVSLTGTNSLIDPIAGISGITAGLQFGKLKIRGLAGMDGKERLYIPPALSGNESTIELAADSYEENRHFFLAHYFRNRYDETMKELPHIYSDVRILRMEVWVTNRTGQYDQVRNIAAFTDLGEAESGSLPSNDANTLYNDIQIRHPNARNIRMADQILRESLESNREYEILERAKMLQSEEFRYNEKLGFISIFAPLQTDDVVAVAFEYLYKGRIYKVGELAADHPEETANCLYMKLLKGKYNNPQMPYWNLMMKNVYDLQAYRINKSDFRLSIYFRDQATGRTLDYLTESNLANRPLIQVMGLDKSDSYGQIRPDGSFDFLEEYTIWSEQGKLIIPRTEPFGGNMKEMIDNPVLAEKYSFQELYDSTRVYARQLTHKNRYIIRATRKGGVNRDYSFWPGNTAYQSPQFNLWFGIEAGYQFSHKLEGGFSFRHLSENSRRYKPHAGEELLKNTLWGANLSYRDKLEALDRGLAYIPWIDNKEESRIIIDQELAYLKAGHKERHSGGYSYIDDFEYTRSVLDLSLPAAWQLASTPFHGKEPLFPEAGSMNKPEYGNNRALIAWYTIDLNLQRKNSHNMPAHLKNDKDQLSNHYSRAVSWQEIYPERTVISFEQNIAPVLNLAYYPEERGPYNLDAESISSDGKLLSPGKRWGGIMRALDWIDFEAANIQHLEFWMMDPFIYSGNQHAGGELYFNLGEISEDILKDGKKFSESGLPVDGNQSQIETTVWGKVPVKQSYVQAFESTAESLRLQDTGLNGLLSEEEQAFPVYREYLEKLNSRLSVETLNSWKEDQLSAFHDPAGDNFTHYRSEWYDRIQADILTRYKRINGTEGNSSYREKGISGHELSGKLSPDSEDLNEDHVMNTAEAYYEYKVRLIPGEMVPGKNFITDKREVTVTLENGNKETIHWYQFKIPLNQYDRKTGPIDNFGSIRFIRMFLTGFKEEVILRFGKLELAGSEWKLYEDSYTAEAIPAKEVELSTVNLEENAARTPVNYVLPPGVKRKQRSSQYKHAKENEQALAIKIEELNAGGEVSVFKPAFFDLRYYKRMQLFVHAESSGNNHIPADGDLSIIVRLGDDLRNSYYEYEIPLRITPAGTYSSSNSIDREIVWPDANRLDIPLRLFTEGKLNGKTNKGIYEAPDPDQPENTVRIRGKPTLSAIQILQLAVRNNSSGSKSTEVWINEWRLYDADVMDGWASHTKVQLHLGDIGQVTVGSRFQSAGFGQVNESVRQKSLEKTIRLYLAATMNIGKLFPEKARIHFPFSYSYETTYATPHFDPYNPDLLLLESEDVERNEVQRRNTVKSLSMEQVNIGVVSDTPMPYDPANFTFSYSLYESRSIDHETMYENTKKQYGSIVYDYQPPEKSVSIFYYVPSRIGFSSTITRNYYEMARKSRDNEFPTTLPVSFSQEFNWDRTFRLEWKVTKQLKSVFESGTQARIEEPYMQVNKKLEPDRYKVWRDSVRQSFLHLGKPVAYGQKFTATYEAPFQISRFTNWLSAEVHYESMYNWMGRPDLPGYEKRGNTIRNQRTIRYKGFADLRLLYDRWDSRNFTRDLAFMLKRVEASYETIDGMTLTGFIPDAGDLFGQRKSGEVMSPGLKFAFGGTRPSYIAHAMDKQWLVTDPSVAEPGVISYAKHSTFLTQWEPVKGLRIELIADYLNSHSSSVYFMQKGMPVKKAGQFILTSTGIRSVFSKKGMPENNYYSPAFERFLNTIPRMAERVEEKYSSLSYPTEGYFVNSPYAGQPYVSGTFPVYSPDVLIPAFLSAYSGKSAGRKSPGLIPSLSALRPNWRIVYDGLTRFPRVRQHFKLISFSHQYRCSYQSGNYTSQLNWTAVEGDKGFIPAGEDIPVPGAGYIFSSVTLTDGFTPFLGVDLLMANNLSVNSQYRTTRSVNLNLTALQLIENHSREIQIGGGYTLEDVNRLFKIRRRKGQKNNLTIQSELILRRGYTLVRKIEYSDNQMASGSIARIVRIHSDYSFSEIFSLRAYFDMEKYIPLVIRNSFSNRTLQFGIGLLINFN